MCDVDVDDVDDVDDDDDDSCLPFLHPKSLKLESVLGLFWVVPWRKPLQKFFCPYDWEISQLSKLGPCAGQNFLPPPIFLGPPPPNIKPFSSYSSTKKKKKSCAGVAKRYRTNQEPGQPASHHPPTTRL